MKDVLVGLGRNRTTDTRIFNPLLEWIFFALIRGWRRSLFVKGIVEGIFKLISVEIGYPCAFSLMIRIPLSAKDEKEKATLG